MGIPPYAYCVSPSRVGADALIGPQICEQVKLLSC